jgi:glutathione synthase/RimK-type ligase-like ATP-grasp enzyme
MKRICLLSCENAKHGASDDAHLVNVLKQNHFEVESIPWRSFYDKKQKFDLVIFRTTWDYYFHLDEFKRFIKKLHTEFKVINSIDTIFWNMDKKYLLDLKQKGVPVVPTQTINDIIDLEKLDFSQFNQWIIKPSISASAYQTYLWEANQIKKNKDQIIQILKTSSVLIQPFIQSVKDHGEISLIYFKDHKEIHFSHSLLKTPKKNDFRVQSEHGGEVLEYHASAKQMEVAHHALKQLPYSWNYARVDLVDYETNPLVMEIELIEPELFFRMQESAAKNYVNVIKSILYG